MVVRPRLDRTSILTGAAVGLVIAVVTLLVWEAITAAFDVDSAVLDFASFAVVVAGWVMAGWVAGRRELTAPYTHAVLAALVAFLPVALFGIIFSIARGNDVRVPEMVFNAIVAACGGLIGGVVAERSIAR